MISIFVSSTFGDMQAERDVLRQRVLPKLKRLASEFGESVRMIDLRWGVNTTALSEEEASRKILDVCFEQIDKCDGRMICLIGTRYGWVPRYDINELEAKFGLCLSSNASATELEIQYGILQRTNPQRAMVFMREEVKSLPEELIGNFHDNNPRLNALKEELLNNTNCKCSRYSLEYENGDFKGLDAFEEMVYAHLCEYIMVQFDVNSIPQHIKIKKQFDAKIDDEIAEYYTLPQLDANAHKFINSSNTFALLKADAGMGKTAFSAHISSIWGHFCKVFPFFCGYNADCETPAQMLKYFICQVSDYLGITTECVSNSIQEITHVLTYLLQQIPEKAVFLIDGVDHLVCSYEERLTWLPIAVPDHIRFVFTTSSQDKSFERLSEYSEVFFLTIPTLKEPGKFLKHFFEMSGKDIQNEILNAAFRNQNIENYYHARMIAEALVMMDRYDFQGIKNSGDDINAINSFLRNALLQFPKSLEGVALFLLHDYGKRIAPELIPEVYIYIACNEGGLRASDLESLFKTKWDELSFERYIAFLSGIIIERENGCYDFASSIIREAVEKLIKWKFKKKVLRHIETLPDDDPLKIRCCLNRSLFYEHYNVVYKLITCNKASVNLADQFVGCLNYMENEIIALLKKYDLSEWFFDSVIPRVTSVQEQDASANIVLGILSVIPSSLKERALEFIGDYYINKDEFTKAEQAFTDALILHNNNCSTVGRLYYKLATVTCVNSEEDYETLLDKLSQSVEIYGKETLPMSINDRMYHSAAKYQLVFMKLYHKLNGIPAIKFFNPEELRLTEEVQTPHLSFIARSRIEKIKEEVIASIKETVDSFNEYRREAEDIYKEAAGAGEINNILEPFILTLNGYDVFGVSAGRIERIKEIKDDIEKDLQNQFNLNLYKILGLLEYELANAEDHLEEKKQHLLKCCTIWGQFISQLSLPDFTRKYINAEMELARIYLDQGDEKSSDEHLAKWSQAQYDYAVNDLRKAFNQCSRYPDEIHLALLEEVRDNIADVNRTKARIKQLGENYSRCQDISRKYFYHLIKSCVFKQLDEFKVRENFSFDSYRWLKDIYLNLSERLSTNPDNREIVEFVCIFLLNLMLQMLDLVADIATNQEEMERYDLKSYYDERVFALEERHRYEMQRLEKIWFGYLYAKSLIAQSNQDSILIEPNCLFAVKIFNTLRRILYENEVTPFRLEYPMISQGRINYELCAVETRLAMYYKDVGLLLSSATTYETIVTLALSLFGTEEDSSAADQIFLRLAAVSCLQALESYSILGIADKMHELREKYDAIKTLSQK